MNGADIKKAAINKAKQVAQAANGNGGKKRRKADLKPIITTSDSNQPEDASAAFHYKCVQSPVPRPFPLASSPSPAACIRPAAAHARARVRSPPT